MKYADFEGLMSVPRMGRYLAACGQNKRKTMTLYRANIRLTHELFSIICLFEIVLRNKIDAHYRAIYAPAAGNEEWLRYAIMPGNFYTAPSCINSYKSISNAINELTRKGLYSHDKLVSGLGFGFWRYQFGSKEFQAAGSTLHTIFPNRPLGTNHTVLFNKLKLINDIRNRVAHHEPICFTPAGNAISTAYVTQHYQEIVDLLNWLNINAADLFYGVDGIQKEIDFINRI